MGRPPEDPSPHCVFLGEETSFLSPGLSVHLPCTLSASLGQEGTADILNIGHDFVLIWKSLVSKLLFGLRVGDRGKESSEPQKIHLWKIRNV